MRHWLVLKCAIDSQVAIWNRPRMAILTPITDYEFSGVVRCKDEMDSSSCDHCGHRSAKGSLDGITVPKKEGPE